VGCVGGEGGVPVLKVVGRVRKKQIPRLLRGLVMTKNTRAGGDKSLRRA